MAFSTHLRRDLENLLGLHECRRLDGPSGVWRSENPRIREALLTCLKTAEDGVQVGRFRSVERLIRATLRDVFPALNVLESRVLDVHSARRYGWVPLPDVFLEHSRFALESKEGWELHVIPQEAEVRGKGRPAIALAQVRVEKVSRRIVVEVLPAKRSKMGCADLEAGIESGLGNAHSSELVSEVVSVLEGLDREIWCSRSLIRDPGGALVTSAMHAGGWEDFEGPELGALWRFLGSVGELLKDRLDLLWEAYEAVPHVLGEEVAVQEEGAKDVRFVKSEDEGFGAAVRHGETMRTQVVLLQGDNADGIRWLEGRARVDAVYTDPPYNTGNSAVYRYRDRSTDVAWQRGLEERLGRLHGIMSRTGVLAMSIDDHSSHQCKDSLEFVWTKDCHLGTLVWRKKVVRGRGARHLLPHTEYVHFYGAEKDGAEAFGEPLTDAMRQEYDRGDESGPYKRIPLAKTGTSQSPRPNLVYPIEAPDGTFIPCPTAQWRWSRETLAARMDEIEFVQSVSGVWRVFTKQRQFLEGEERLQTPSSLYDRATTSHGTKEIKDLFGSVAADFPKPTRLIRDLLSWIEARREGGHRVYFDPYAGSASTVDALLRMSLEDSQKRTIFACERGVYFDALTVARVMKCIQSVAWKKGIPTGGPMKDVALRIVRLEGYQSRVERLASKRLNDSLK